MGIFMRISPLVRGGFVFLMNGFPENRQKPHPTAYPIMVTNSQDIGIIYNVSAAAFSWILLAGYLVLPNTFNTLRSSTSMKGSASTSDIGQATYNLFQNTPLLIIAGILCFLATCGEVWLWWTWRNNFLWLQGKIFW